jgi:hypothetical protein
METQWDRTSSVPHDPADHFQEGVDGRSPSVRVLETATSPVRTAAAAAAAAWYLPNSPKTKKNQAIHPSRREPGRPQSEL